MTLDLKNVIHLVTLIVVIGGGFNFTGRVSASLETLTTLVQEHSVRLDAHDRLLGRGIPPPEVTNGLQQLGNRVAQLERRMESVRTRD